MAGGTCEILRAGGAAVALTVNAYTIAKNKKPSLLNWAYRLNSLGWLMGLEPTTTGITILDSTN